LLETELRSVCSVFWTVSMLWSNQTTCLPSRYHCRVTIHCVV